jgi:hypothetical protein
MATGAVNEYANRRPLNRIPGGDVIARASQQIEESVPEPVRDLVEAA